MTRCLLTLAMLGAVSLAPRVRNAQASQQGKTAAVGRAIDDLWAHAVDGMKKADAVALTALYTEDAMIIEPDSPTATGRAEIEANLKQAFASAKFLDMT